MNPSKFMDKQITELSPSTIHDFPYFSDLHEEEDEEDHLFSSSNFRPIRSLPVCPPLKFLSVNFLYFFVGYSLSILVALVRISRVSRLLMNFGVIGCNWVSNGLF